MKIKTVNDYYDAIYLKFPQIPLKDILRMIKYGWRSLYLHNSYGGDTLIKDKDIWCYIGQLRSNSLSHFLYYIRKLIIKIRVLNKRKKIPWNGYYYFALTDKQYENYTSQHNKRGRKRRYFNYGNQFLFRLLEECKINRYNRKYIFRVPYGVDLGFKIYEENFTTDKAELIETRDTLKFKDILVYNNNYKYE